MIHPYREVAAASNAVIKDPVALSDCDGDRSASSSSVPSLELPLAKR